LYGTGTAGARVARDASRPHYVLYAMTDRLSSVQSRNILPVIGDTAKAHVNPILSFNYLFTDLGKIELNIYVNALN